jgi:type I restriction enzyme S subunit
MTEASPEGWASVKLEQVTAKVGSGSTPRGGSDAYQQTGIPLIRSMNVRFEGFSNDGLAFLSRSQAEQLKEATVRSGDVLLNITGASIGRVTQAPPHMDGARVNQHVCIIRPTPDIDGLYLSNYLASPSVQRMIWNEQYGVTRQALTKAQILDFDIPVPPRNEQLRMIGSIRRLIGLRNSASDHLSQVRAILKRFRQAVLAAACSGRLTEDWRQHNPNLSIGVADLLTGMTPGVSSVWVPNDEDPMELFEIPAEWAWASCEHLCDSHRALTYGVIKLGAPVENGTPTLRSSDVRWLRIDEEDVKCISKEIASDYARTFLRGGEILVTVRGTLGGVAVVPSHLAGFNISREVAVLPIHDSLVADFFCYAIAANWSQKWLMQVSKGVAYTGVNIRDLKRLPIPVPPMAEQREVVRRVKALLALADDIEQRATAALRRVDRMTQSILAKAFRGELVPTEAELARREGREYEPASVLLDRIKKERASAMAETTPSSKRKSLRKAKTASAE